MADIPLLRRSKPLNICPLFREIIRRTRQFPTCDDVDDNIFTTSGETSAAQNPIPRTQPSLQTARDLLPGRKVDRRKYLETARSVEIEEDKKTSDKGRQGSELVSLIDKDVARTYQDIQYFKTPQVKRILKRILVQWRIRECKVEERVDFCMFPSLYGHVHVELLDT
eukprot:1362448-Amorphochlora_amoeboformis.AAC.1